MQLKTTLTKKISQNFYYPLPLHSYVLTTKFEQKEERKKIMIS